MKLIVNEPTGQPPKQSTIHAITFATKQIIELRKQLATSP